MDLIFSDLVFSGEKSEEPRPVKKEAPVVAIQDEEVFWYKERQELLSFASDYLAGWAKDTNSEKKQKESMEEGR